jgi:sugar-specific transcriptional regulator TrmB
MIVKQDFLNKLKSLGLNTYEAKLWLALLSVGTSTAGELSDIANVPRSRSYDVLEGLEKKGFIITRLGKPIKYLAIPPEEVLERVKQKIRKKYEDKTDSMDKLKESNLMNDLHELHNQAASQSKPLDLTGSIKGRDKIYTQLSTMIRNADNSVVLLTTEEGFKRKSEKLSRSIEKAKKKGVDIKTYIFGKKKLEQLKKHQSILNPEYTDKINSRMCIVDNKEAMLMLYNDGSLNEDHDVAVWLKAPYVASALKDLVHHTHK